MIWSAPHLLYCFNELLQVTHGKPHHRTRVNCATESSLATSAIIPVKCAYWDFMTERAWNNFSFARWWKQPRGNKKGILCFNYGENGTPNHVCFKTCELWRVLIQVSLAVTKLQRLKSDETSSRVKDTSILHSKWSFRLFKTSTMLMLIHIIIVLTQDFMFIQQSCRKSR